MSLVQSLVACIGRICLGAIFLLSSITEMMDWEGTNHYLLTILARWTKFYLGNAEISSVMEEMISHSSWILLLAMGLKLLGSLLVIFGMKVRFGAFLLILFLVPATILAHDFWHLDGATKAVELVMFLKNLSIFGGLALALTYGTGVCKKEAPRAE